MSLRLTDGVDLDAYYDADAARHDARTLAVVTREVFRRFYGDSPSVGFEADGRAVGGVIFDGEVPHIAVLPEWRGRWGPLLRPMLRWLYGLRPEILIRVDAANAPLRDFVRHCGWPEVGRAPGETIHRMAPDAGRRVVRVDAPARGPAPAAGQK